MSSDYEYMRERKMITVEGLPVRCEPTLWLTEEDAIHFYDDEFNSEVGI